MRIQKNKGFIPIELLIASQMVIVIASSLVFAQEKANDAYFQLSTSSVVPAAVMCCYDGGHLNNIPGEELCALGESGTYPATDRIDSITILQDCDENGSFSIKFTAAKTSTDKATSALCTEAGCTFVSETPVADQLTSD